MNKTTTEHQAAKLVADLNRRFKAIARAHAEIAATAERSDASDEIVRILDELTLLDREFDAIQARICATGARMLFDRISGEYFLDDGTFRMRITSVSHGYLSVAASSRDEAISKARQLLEFGEVELVEDSIMIDDVSETV